MSRSAVAASPMDPGAYSWQLIERAQAGDAEAFGEFYEQHVDAVYRYLVGRVRNQQTAEDLTADTFFRALRSVHRLRREHATPRAWLMTIARNTLYDHWRSAQVQRTELTDQPPDVPDPQPQPAEQVELDLDAVMIRGLIRRLDGDQRRCLELRYLYNLTPAEIAAELNRSTPAVAALHHRAIRRLRAMINPHRLNGPTTGPTDNRGQQW